MNPLRFTRRNLLRGSLAATAMIPFLEARRVTGQSAGPPIRLLVIHTPNGTRNDLFWPSGTEKDFTLPLISKPLEAIKDKVTFLKGITLNPALQNGPLGGTVGSEHARGTGGMLTGRPLKSGKEFVSFGNTTSGWGTGQSIDQYLAETLKPPTTHKSLQVGVHVRDTEVRARISYSGPERPIPPREDPKDVFSALFGAAVTGGTPTTPGEADAALARLRAQRKSVFDLTLAETTRLRNLVGTADKARLDAHMQYIRDIEERLTALPATEPTTGGGSTACAPPSVGTVDLKDDAIYESLGKLQMDLVASAFACDQTRIVTFQWSYSESEHLFQFLNLNGTHHVISHDFSSRGTNYDAYNTIQTWYASQVAYFLSKLDSYQEGDGTVLDNTIVLWGSEIGQSTTHDLTLMPYVLAGRAGGKINAGRYIDYTKGKKPDNNQLLVSLAHAMGAEELMSFGDSSGATGPLPTL